MNYIKKYFIIGLIINNDKVYVHIINDKKAKGRFLDYGLRRMIKEIINNQISNHIFYYFSDEPQSKA